jgi:hypothetical protein
MALTMGPANQALLAGLLLRESGWRGVAEEVYDKKLLVSAASLNY